MASGRRTNAIVQLAGGRRREASSMAIQIESRNAEWAGRAARVMPHGAVGVATGARGGAFVAARGEGSKIYDADDNVYIDYVLGSGPLILGHAHPAITEAVIAQARRGSHFYALNEPIIELAEQIVAAVPCAEKVKFASTGSEATFLAMRYARAFTGRDKVLKFEGGYHGHSDYALVASTPQRPVDYPVAPADSAGVPRPVADQMLVAPYNDAALAGEIIAAYGRDLAAVIVEPYQRVIPPQPGFLQALREATKAHDVLLIFDEVVTGFRLAWGGAQERYDVVPDLAVYGKTIGGGYAISAVAGRAEIIELTDPRRRDDARFTFFGGTFSGNPLAATAGSATLRELGKPGTYDRMRATGDRLAHGLQGLLAERGIPGQVLWDGPIVTLLFTDQPVTDYRSAQTADKRRMARWYEGLLARGMLVNPAVQKFYLSAVHSEADIDATLAAAREVLAEME
jgi:glutamate-1-semialdehyde 2,1-aminomutase